ncbi:MAG: histidine kinase [Muricauda sp.]|nr:MULTISPECIES: histidine kinase [unclassified Allomuricauda]MAU15068.1 histidine kinase [Allomuricauda sp.]|tara:strand:+ start:21340 stop:22371 length:1032 start_codon:yes stop_codon:yes gene_type:complete
METTNNKRRSIFIHVTVWLILFIVPYLLSYESDQAFRQVVAFSWTPLTLFLFVFYFNYLFLADKLFFDKKIFLFIAINLLVIVAMTALREHFIETYFPRPQISERKGPPRNMIYYVNTISFLVPVVSAVALRAMERLISNEIEKKEVAHQQLKSDLQHLQYQLQPHFFFNSLNNIYALVDISPEKAKSTIHSLGKLMRYLLYETHTDKVPLNKEIDFMVKYIELGKLRLTDKTTVTYNFPKVDATLEVPPLLFISLIENAFKHGVSAQEKSTITFDMSIKDGCIVFKGMNTDFPKNQADKSGSGIGLKNLRERLELLYPNKHYFNTEKKSGQYLVTVEIPING